jgi:hypothetical protein
MDHSYEECPLHGEMTSTYDSLAECLGVEIPKEIRFNKREVVRFLHNHIEKLKGERNEKTI